MLQFQSDFVADGLHLFLVGAGADDEEVGERGDAREVEDYQLGGLLRFGGADGDQPRWRSSLGIGGFFEIALGQNRLLKVSYYRGKALGLKGAGRNRSGEGPSPAKIINCKHAGTRYRPATVRERIPRLCHEIPRSVTHAFSGGRLGSVRKGGKIEITSVTDMKSVGIWDRA